MKNKKIILVLGSFIVLFSMTAFLNFKQLGNSLDSGINLETIIQAYSANAESGSSNCTGTSCSNEYDYNDGSVGGAGCCNKYTTTTGKRN
jgi:hypothetical protein